VIRASARHNQPRGDGVDAASAPAQGGYSGTGAKTGCAVCPPDTRANLAEMYRRLQAAGAKVLLCGRPLPAELRPGQHSGVSKRFSRPVAREKTGLVPFFLEGVVTRRS